MDHKAVQQALRAIADPEITEKSQRFFKTRKSDYGENDRFLGIRVPDIRKIARRFEQLPLTEIEKNLHSEYHEERLCALLIMVEKAKKADPDLQKNICDLYLQNTGYINNWDLVDISAEHIVGRYLADKDRTALYGLARSENLWERRIAILSTFHFIKNGNFHDTIAIAEILLRDEHDLIQKASGWMLREVGNRDIKTEELFLDKHVQNMPRTMLRYAIEKFPEEKRQAYLKM